MAVPPEDVLAVLVCDWGGDTACPPLVWLPVETVGDVVEAAVDDVDAWDVDPVCPPPAWLPVEPVPAVEGVPGITVGVGCAIPQLTDIC